MYWKPQENRKRGRPKQTWRRSIFDESNAKGKHWKEVKGIAHNRVRWRRILMPDLPDEVIDKRMCVCI